MHYRIGLTVEARDEEEARRFAETIGAGPGQQWDRPLVTCGSITTQRVADPAAQVASEAHGDGFCPECHSANICAQPADEDRTPWACLDCDAQFEDPELPMYAVVVVTEAKDPEAAWQGVADALTAGADDSLVRYVGAPWESIPAGTVEFDTDLIRLGMTIPCETPELRERAGTAYVRRELTPCD